MNLNAGSYMPALTRLSAGRDRLAVPLLGAVLVDEVLVVVVGEQLSGGW